MKGKMWCVIKTMYNSSRSAVLLEGEKFSIFSVEQGVAQLTLSFPNTRTALLFTFACKRHLLQNS